MKRILLETIVSSLDDAQAAAEGGADRFELCSALALGGLTPSLGLLAAIKAEGAVPVMFMLRPREGGMAYTDGEVAVIERDADLALAAGADGLVVGFLTPEGEVDVPRCRRFVERFRARTPTRLPSRV
jgi:copper homeostasis protein